MNKEEIIIDGIDVSECRYLFDDKNKRNRCSIALKDCKYLGEDCYFKQLKCLQQELDIKEKMLDKFMIGSGETLEKLQKENEGLKEKNKSIAKDYVGVFGDYQKYKQALEEIRNIAELDVCYNAKLDKYTFNTYAQRILATINEVLNDRN